jgi:hypothetical protein
MTPCKLCWNGWEIYDAKLIFSPIRFKVSTSSGLIDCPICVKDKKERRG